MWGEVSDIITCAKFQNELLRHCDSTEGRNFHFSITGSAVALHSCNGHSKINRKMESIGVKGKKRWESDGVKRGKQKSFELYPTIRTEVMVKKGFSNFDLYLGLTLTYFSPKLTTFFRELLLPFGKVW